ncbi:MAG: Na+/H+ antiporter NhaC family protein [Pseudomonadota bacterium]
MEPKPNGIALLPLVLFLALFIGVGSALTAAGVDFAFYQMSPTVAIMPAIALAVILGGKAISDNINTFLKGAGEINIITMCVIYLLAGGFASVAKAVGGVDATVNFGLSIIPAEFVLPGLFLISAFIATSMGTAMGTVAAVGPMAVGVAGETGIGVALLMGAVVGGAMFGDNLSMISDTTIAATRTQGCRMDDKFRMNFVIALPAAIVAAVLYWSMGTAGQTTAGDWEFIRVVPYLAIIIMALLRVNVFVVLFAGIILAGCVGLFTMPEYTLLKWTQDIYGGFTGMHEILVLSMLMGGLGELIRTQGGLAWILAGIAKLTNSAKTGGSRRVGEAGIAMLASLADICTANNTVAIILTGRMAKDLAETNGVDPRRSASILDIFSCVFQGIIPYGAQVLLAGSIAGISPIDISMNNVYCYLLAIAGIASILIGKPSGLKK